MGNKSLSLQLIAPLLVAALAAGCATMVPAPVSDNVAVVALVDGARADSAAGKHVAAAASLERALRIEPKNAMLWHELAQLRLQQGQHAQAEAMAARSNSWAGTDERLRAANWRLIAEVRAQRGDEVGARQAMQRAGQLAR